MKIQTKIEKLKSKINNLTNQLNELNLIHQSELNLETIIPQLNSTPVYHVVIKQSDEITFNEVVRNITYRLKDMGYSVEADNFNKLDIEGLLLKISKQSELTELEQIEPQLTREQQNNLITREAALAAIKLIEANRR